MRNRDTSQEEYFAGTFVSKDGCMSWEKLAPGFIHSSRPFLFNDKIYFNATKSNYSIDDGFYEYDYTKESVRLISDNMLLGADKETYRMFDGYLYFFRRTKTSAEFYKQLENGDIKLITSFRESIEGAIIKDYYVNGNEICVFTGKIGGVYIKFYCYRSLDGGVNWSKEKLAVTNYLEPIFFLDKPNGGFYTWINSGASRIQMPKKQLEYLSKKAGR